MDGLNISAINSRVAVEAPEPAPLLNIAVANGSFFGSICGDSLALQVAQAGVQSGGGEVPPVKRLSRALYRYHYAAGGVFR